MSGTYWLASYPKSGNTWFRIFLTNLIRDAEEPVHINQLDATPIFSARVLFDEFTGVDSANLTHEETARLQPRVYEFLARDDAAPRYRKIHDAYTLLEDGSPLIPTEATLGALYFIRNPLDVAVSFAHHGAIPIDRSIARMANASFTFCDETDRLLQQLPQRLLTWSEHVKSWVDQCAVPVHVMRYEDMKRAPLKTFSAAARFAHLPDDAGRIQKALENSDIKELQRQEAETVFRERAPKAESFFRKGEAGSWRESLSEAQVERILADHGEIMQRFGYLDASGNIVE
ncbi:MAG: sulfotransferase domain-containing protein [Candidatus Hydrogenedentes bacterium]|nr:sulfotransferase domain-containing protein [Candidatus Hydrogenedentota bacterium]